MNLETLRNLLLAGESAYKAQDDLDDNPYTIGTQQHEYWAKGWFIGRDTDE